jgi:hypothetical protein
VARHDEAISGSHRLHFCDNRVARCRLHRRGRHLHLRAEWQLCGEQRRSLTRSDGGALTPNGYNFGVNEGLSVSGTGAFDSYSIDIRFYFNDINASSDGFQRILDFKNRQSDSGLYSESGQLVLFATSGSGDPSAESFAHDFTNGTMADLLVTRDASGLFSAFVNGHFAFSVMDTNGATTFSGPDNIIYFFMDDFVSLTNFPDRPEAGTGLVDFIQVTTPAAAVPGPIAGAGLPGLIAGCAGLLGRWRRRTA